MFKLLKKLIATTFGPYLINKISSSLEMKIIGVENYNFLKEIGKKCIFVFWHGQQFYPIYYFKNKNIAIMVSLSNDGEIQTNILSKFGYSIVRGSSSRGAVPGLIGLFKKLREGYDVAIALDGPKGPYHVAKTGVNYLSIKTNAAILPIACAFKKYKVFEKSWDKYILPYPYTQGVMIIGKPIFANKLNVPIMIHKYLEVILNDLTIEAEQFVNDPIKLKNIDNLSYNASMKTSNNLTSANEEQNNNDKDNNIINVEDSSLKLDIKTDIKVERLKDVQVKNDVKSNEKVLINEKNVQESLLNLHTNKNNNQNKDLNENNILDNKSDKENSFIQIKKNEVNTKLNNKKNLNKTEWYD